MANPATDGEGVDSAEGEAKEGNGDWLRYGQALLYIEMVIAIVITIFSLYLAFSGQTGFLA